MSRLKRWGRDLLVLALLMLVMIWVMDSWRAPQVPLAFADQPMHTVDGREVTLSTLSQERPLLVYFWASWCNICRFTTPAVAAMAEDGSNVIGIVLRSGEDAKVERYLQAKEYRMPLINDKDGRLSASWQVSVTPTLVIIDKGRVVSSTSGFTSSWGMRLRLWWAGWH
ncbi:protein disulfide oxidoreductase [Erwinia sorbitola]|uniref:Redoxin domain-containing protein n=1 Tax=Erwinia sorbitola TaxID=2681984 RepID=A0ABW9RDI2_9GAMM|nr:protein disulfide oxidoreductase [Erwinia sorbitola]MTD26921.1 redoxin domain-containing protein [Erwinia sorbitola]